MNIQNKAKSLFRFVYQMCPAFTEDLIHSNRLLCCRVDSSRKDHTDLSIEYFSSRSECSHVQPRPLCVFSFELVCRGVPSLNTNSNCSLYEDRNTFDHSAQSKCSLMMGWKISILCQVACKQHVQQ